MRDRFRTLFQPILRLLEGGEGEYRYRPAHRQILVVVGLLFIVLAAVAAYFSALAGEWGGLLPFVVFLLGGALCLLVALLGNDRAVARMWGNR